MFKNKDSSSKKHGFNWSAYGRLEFVSLLEKTRERATYMKRQVASEDDEHLRMSEFIALVIDSDFNNDLTATYTSLAESSTVSMVAGVPIDNPPGYDI